MGLPNLFLIKSENFMEKMEMEWKIKRKKFLRKGDKIQLKNSRT